VAALVVDLDASDSSSYPGTGSAWTNLVDETDYTIENGGFSSDNGGAITFNGTDTRVNIGTPLQNGSSFTKEAWVLDNGSPPTSRNIVSSSSHVFFVSGSKLHAGLSGQYRLTESSGNLPTGVWRHVVATFDDSATNTLTLYIDGVQVDQETVTQAYSQQTTYIGAHVS
jgi:hypothetical protein